MLRRIYGYWLFSFEKDDLALPLWHPLITGTIAGFGIYESVPFDLGRTVLRLAALRLQKPSDI